MICPKYHAVLSLRYRNQHQFVHYILVCIFECAIKCLGPNLSTKSCFCSLLLQFPIWRMFALGNQKNLWPVVCIILTTKCLRKNTPQIANRNRDRDRDREPKNITPKAAASASVPLSFWVLSLDLDFDQANGQWPMADGRCRWQMGVALELVGPHSIIFYLRFGVFETRPGLAGGAT